MMSHILYRRSSDVGCRVLRLVALTDTVLDLQYNTPKVDDISTLHSYGVFTLAETETDTDTKFCNHKSYNGWHRDQ